MNRLLTALVATLLSLPIFGQSPNAQAVKLPDLRSQSVNYISNRTPLEPTAFIKLPLGAIRPQGWMSEMLNRQRDGLAGHLGEISAWLTKKGNAWLEKEGQAGWEELPYWLRGYCDMAYILNDEAMKKEAQVWIEGILRSQQPDGWFGPVVINNKGSRDYWGNMLALFTLQHYYEATGDRRVLTLMSRYFKYELAQPDNQFLASYWEHSRGGDNLLSVYWLYNITGEKWLLDLATKIYRCTADWRMKDNLPNWHNVNIAECFREPATYYMQSKKDTDLQASYHVFDYVRELYGQVPGGMFGSDENCRPGYGDPRQATETCGFAEQMTSDGFLTAITGDTRWADNCEEVMFNSFPAAFTPDMKALRYLTAPNMVLADDRNHAPGIQNKGPFLMMNPFSSRCCQHNHAHGLAYYIGNLFMATNDNGLVANLYGASTVTAKVGNKVQTTLVERTNYPFDEKITLEINPAKAVRFPLYLRIPAWCKGATVAVNGQPQSLEANPNGYLRLDRKWSKGDRVELTLPMTLTVKTWTKNKNSISVNYGPLTFSLYIKENYIRKSSDKTAIRDSRWQEGADVEKWPSYEIQAASAWNYGVIVDAQHPETSFSVEKRAYPADNNPFTNDTAPIVLKAKGRRIPAWGLDQYWLCGILPESPVTSTQPVETLTLVPMGGARLRISAIPTIR